MNRTAKREESASARWPRFFDGSIQVNRDIQLSNGDCAEEFDVCDIDSVSPGMVMVLSDTGALRACDRA